MVLKISVLALIVIIAFIAIITIKGIKELKTESLDKISFKEAMELTDLPVVTFYNKDKKLNFLLDTGSNESYINQSVIAELEHKVAFKHLNIIGSGGNNNSSLCCNFQISYRDKSYNEEFNILDLEEAFATIKSESGVQIHGILGNKFFEKYKYILDFNKLVAYSKK